MTGDLLQAGAAERRVVTILFADLAGYTAFCQARDPEAVHLVVRPLMSSLRAACEAAGAIVPGGIAGDGFMAVFGARRTHEDDAAAALETGVRLQQLVTARQELVPDLPGLHVGLHTGEVLVAWQQDEAQLSGDPVNVASRLATTSLPGEVLVSEECVPLTRCALGWGEPEELELRGRRGSVVVRRLDWRAVGAGLRAPRWGHETEYVPRPALEAALRAALGSGGAVVVGEAGAGKSRLAVQVLQGRRTVVTSCSQAHHPSAEDLLAQVLTQVGGLEDQVALLASGPPGSRDDDACAALLTAAVRRLGTAVPGVVVQLDDAESLQVGEVQRLATALTPDVTWVVTSRVPLPMLPLTQVDVPDMTDTERDDLVQELLPDASDAVRDVLVRRGGARPLYLEQCARLLREAGTVRVGGTGTELVAPERLREVPTSMRLFVSSRIDLLDKPLRQVLDVAAVLGDYPDLPLLRHLAEEEDGSRIEQLVERGLLRWERGPAVPRLRFAHALVRDVAYETLLRAERARIHLLAAEWYAVLPVSQELELQAVHLEAAVVHGDGDCDTLRRAVRAMALFARSVEQERTRLASDTLQRARRLAESRPECAAETLVLELATASVAVVEGRLAAAAEAAERAIALGTAAGDRRAVAEAQLHLGSALLASARPEALELLLSAERAFEDLDDPGSQARVVVARSLHTVQEHGVAQQVTVLEEAHELAMRSGDARLRASTAQQLAMHAGFTSGWQAFERWSQQARDVSRGDDVGLEPRFAATRAWLAACELAPHKGLDDARAALVAGRDLGLYHVYMNALVTYLELALMSGDLALGDELLEQARAATASRPGSWRALQVELCAAQLLQRTGEAARAVAMVDAVAQEPVAQTPQMQHDVEETRAWMALERGAFAEARAHGARAALLSDEMRDTCLALRPRYFDLVAAVCGELPLALSDIAALRAGARDTGLVTLAELSTRWLYVDELARGWSVDDHHLEPAETVEARALDLEIDALSTRQWDGLAEAAQVWSQLGSTVWQARALVWYGELTGTPQPVADQLLRDLQAPAGLADRFRAQVAALRA